MAMLTALWEVTEDDTETSKSKKEMLDEIAVKTNENLALKQQLEEIEVEKNQMKEEVVSIRESQLNSGRKSSEGGMDSSPFERASGQKIDFDEYEIVSK